MNININKQAKEYIKEKSNDKSVSIVVTSVGSGWRVFYEPAVKLGKLDREKDFKLYNVDDIKVYIASGLIEGESVKIYLSKFLWMKSLKVEGLAC